MGLPSNNCIKKKKHSYLTKEKDIIVNIVKHSVRNNMLLTFMEGAAVTDSKFSAKGGEFVLFGFSLTWQAALFMTYFFVCVFVLLT